MHVLSMFSEASFVKDTVLGHHKTRMANDKTMPYAACQVAEQNVAELVSLQALLDAYVHTPDDISTPDPGRPAFTTTCKAFFRVLRPKILHGAPRAEADEAFDALWSNEQEETQNPPGPPNHAFVMSQVPVCLRESYPSWLGQSVEKKEEFVQRMLRYDMEDREYWQLPPPDYEVVSLRPGVARLIVMPDMSPTADVVLFVPELETDPDTDEPIKDHAGNRIPTGKVLHREEWQVKTGAQEVDWRMIVLEVAKMQNLQVDDETAVLTIVAENVHENVREALRDPHRCGGQGVFILSHANYDSWPEALRDKEVSVQEEPEKKVKMRLKEILLPNAAVRVVHESELVSRVAEAK